MSMSSCGGAKSGRGHAIAEVDCCWMWRRWLALFTMFLMAELSPSKMMACSLTLRNLSSACCFVSLLEGVGGLYLWERAFSLTSLASPCQKVCAMSKW